MTNIHDNAILQELASLRQSVDLLRNDLRHTREHERASAVAELQAIVDDALASGISDQTFEEIIEEVRAEMDANQSA